VDELLLSFVVGLLPPRLRINGTWALLH